MTPKYFVPAETLFCYRFFFHFDNSSKKSSMQNFSQIYQVVQEEKFVLVV